MLRNAGAIRIDHVIGLFRLWWIPGAPAPATAYVRYDHEALVGILALEAHRAGAVVIGEDLGVVEPWVRDYLSDRGILGTSVLWFERDMHGAQPPEHYRPLVLATVTTHDLPPDRGIPGRRARRHPRPARPARPSRSRWSVRRRSPSGTRCSRPARPRPGRRRPVRAQIIEALHLLPPRAPSVLVGVSLADAVGERRAQNQPGTDQEYPNWKVPLADPVGTAVVLDELAENQRFRSLTDAVDVSLRL